MHPSITFLNCVLDNFVFQHIKVSTHFREGQQPSCLDLIFTNEKNMVDLDLLNIDLPLGKSDHAVIHFNYMCYFINNVNMREKFQYFRGDYEAIINDLDAIDWDNVLDDQSVDEMWNTFKSKLYDSMEKHISSNNKFINPPLWMDGKTKGVILKKRRAWKKYSYA